MAKKKYFSVGVIGFSQHKFDEETAFERFAQAMELIRLLIPSFMDLEIVSGLTNLGIPAMAYQYAAVNEIRTVGIACAKARDFDCFPCDEVQIVGKKWGAESRRFLKRCDVVIRLGGGKQSFKEIKKAKELGMHVLEFDLEDLTISETGTK